MKQLLISRDPGETRVALLEDGKLAELYMERPGRLSMVGNIYKGRVENVLGGMDAAFVDIGLDKNGFLYVDEVMLPETAAGPATRPVAGPATARGVKITDVLKPGKEIVVQVTRDPMGRKGPRLTTQLGLAGRHLVYLPESSISGVSRRLEPEERDRLRGLIKELRLEVGGVIVRTAAEGADLEAVSRDLRFLQRTWGAIRRRAAEAHAPALVFTEAELAVRAVRDLLRPGFESVLVDDEDLCRRVGNYLRAVAPELAEKVQHFVSSSSLFEAFGIEGEARKALTRRVELPSGGHLVIDHTEAMTVIDVNTGRFVGKRFLGDTTLKTNLEACREIMRQLRLRDIGGIIVIDFIDMTSRTSREQVVAALEAELSRDRTKTYVVEISPLGLVEMTRQNITLGLREVMTTTCPTCRGLGVVLSEESAALEVERGMRKLARQGAGQVAGQVLCVELHPRVAAWLLAGNSPRLKQLEAQTGVRFMIQAAEEGSPLDRLEVITS